MSILTIERSGVVVPGIVAPQVGSSDYEKAFGGITNLLEGKTSLYYTFVSSLNTIAKVSQTWTSERHAQNATIASIRLPRYIVTANYSFHDVARENFEGNVAGVSYKDFQDNMCIQAIAQKVRSGALYGFKEGEGLLANTSTFTFGNQGNNSTAQTYDPAWFRNKIIEMVRMLLGEVQGKTDKVVLLTSRRMAYYIGSVIVSLADSQKDGAGVDTIGGSLARIVKDGLQVECEVIIDDTLENGDATGAKDLFIAVAPGISQDPIVGGGADINSVGLSMNSIPYNTTIDKGYTREEINPKSNRVTSGEHYAYVSPGYALRAEAVFKAEITF